MAKKEVVVDSLRRCCTCKQLLPLTAFPKDQRKRFGRNYQCKQCKQLIVKVWRRRNRQHINAQHASWCAQHPERIQAKNKKYYAEHSDQIAARNHRYWQANKARLSRYSAKSYSENSEQRKQYQRERYITHREQAVAANGAWRRTHPEKWLEYKRRRRARRHAVDENFTTEMAQFVHAFWSNKCAICGSCDKLTIDHWLPLSLGHALNMRNAVLLCARCNARKGSKLPEQLCAWAPVEVIGVGLALQDARRNDSLSLE